MIFSVQKGKDVLRIDGDEYNEIIQDLILAIPQYISYKTGLEISEIEENSLAQIAGIYILQQWYFGDAADIVKLDKIIDSIMLTIKKNDEQA